jgi:ribosome assembly protein 1
MPLEKGILSMVVTKCPSPKKAQQERMSVICPDLESEYPPAYLSEHREEFKQIRKSLMECSNTEDSPAVVYITKMQPVSAGLYDAVIKNKFAGGVLSSGVKLIAFARVFSGCLKPGQKVFIMGPKHGEGH